LVAQLRSYNLGERVGDRAAAASVLYEALATVSDAGSRGRLDCLLAQTDLLACDLHAAVDRASPLMECGDETITLRAAYVVSIALALLGRLAEALEVAAAGEAALERADDPRKPKEATLTGATLALLGAGRLADARTTAELGYRVALDIHDDESIAMYALLRGWILVEEGRVKTASVLFREAVAVSGETGNVPMHRIALGGLALSEGMAGVATAATSAVNQFDSMPGGWIAFFDADLVERGRAWSLAADGKMTEARQVLERAAAVAADRGVVVSEARLLHDMVRLGHPTPLDERLVTLAGRAEGALVAACAEHALAVTRGSGRALQTATSRFEDLGAFLLAAEAATEAATAYRREGSKRAAAEMTRTATQLWSMCEEARTPARTATNPVAGPELTSREREIALLASQGRSSRFIAEQLCISVRTVDNHLLHAYTKLGISGREGLADAMGFAGTAV
jgi:DNA-binding CsgD family transcriptional regulator